MHNQINKIQYVDLRSTHYWYELEESEISAVLYISSDEAIPLPNSKEFDTDRARVYAYKGRLKYGDFLVLKNAHEAYLLFVNTRGVLETIAPNAKHKEQIRTLGLSKEIMQGKGNVAACVRLAHGIRNDPKAWGMATEPAIPAFVERLKEVNSTFHTVHKDALGLIEQYGVKVDIVERPRMPELQGIAVYDEDSTFIVHVGRDFADFDRAESITQDFVEGMHRLLRFLKARSECIALIGVERTDSMFNLSGWGYFKDDAVDYAIENLEAAIIYSDPVATFKALIAQPEIYELRTVPQNAYEEGMLIWSCESLLTEDGVAFRPSYRGFIKSISRISWMELEKRFGIAKSLYDIHASIQALLDRDEEEEFQPHHILRICYRQIMEQSKGIESYTPAGGFDIGE
jgi:hypothetical protein